MKKIVARFAALAFVFGLLAAFAPLAQGQGAAQAQKLAALAKQLNLTPEQKTKLMPILEADAPKLQAIKNNASLGPMQKMEQLKAIHAQSDPQIKSDSQSTAVSAIPTDSPAGNSAGDGKEDGPVIGNGRFGC